MLFGGDANAVPIGTMEFPLRFDELEEIEWYILRSKDVPGYLKIRRGAKIDVCGRQNQVNVEEITCARARRTIECVFGHLLTDGSQLLNRDHFGGIDENSIVIEIGRELALRVLILAEVYREHPLLAGPDECGFPLKCW